MMKNLSVLLFLVLCTLCTKAQVRTEYLFEKGWKFTREDGTDFMKPGYDDARWQSVTIPHDWAIYGPFSIHNDQQNLFNTLHLTCIQNILIIKLASYIQMC